MTSRLQRPYSLDPNCHLPSISINTGVIAKKH